MRRKNIRQIKKLLLLTPGQLSDLTGVRTTSLKYWTEINLLNFIQEGPRLIKRYPAKDSVKRLKKILAYKKKGKTISEIILLFQNEQAKRKAEVIKK